jgi:hypothetical protein
MLPTTAVIHVHVYRLIILKIIIKLEYTIKEFLFHIYLYFLQEIERPDMKKRGCAFSSGDFSKNVKVTTLCYI